MYVGSGGVAFALFKYFLLLKSEKNEKTDEFEEYLDACIQKNIELVEASDPDDCGSFLMSGSVGLSTLIVLHMLSEEPKEAINMHLIHSIIETKIASAFEVSMTE